ncbi:MAG: hypothetical protein JW740_01840 [Candidatus Zambryskibacteria bacterium]|nr:hypothetical protein [Candidatus Zambryskibacteria bacterium]
MNPWPSKKVLSVSIVVVALVISIIIAFGGRQTKEVVNFANDLITGDKAEIPENPNWEAEIEKFSKNSEINSGSEELSTIDAVSKLLFINYLNLKQSGNLNEDTIQYLASQSLVNIEQNSDQIEKVEKLNTIPDQGKDTIITYGENLGSILKRDKLQTGKNEIDIVKEALETKDESVLKQLDTIIIIYKRGIDDLKKMAVPKTFEKAHLDILNGTIQMAEAIKMMENVLIDPITGMQVMELYNEGLKASVGALYATINFIRQNNIIYEQNSGGYYLLYGI